VAWSDPDPRGEAGFATPAATVISLAVAIVAVAVTAASVAELRTARQDLDLGKTEYALAGGQNVAALSALQSADSARLRWTFPSPTGTLDALAEPERPKLSPAAAVDLDSGLLSALGVIDPITLRARLRKLSESPRPRAGDIEAADDSRTWRLCAGSIVSPFGEATSFHASGSISPQIGDLSWRAGELWRVRVTAPSGWADDRLVRFTGDRLHPTAVIEQRLYRRATGEDPCEKIMAAADRSH
jgi:hypothetical protein